MQKTRIIFPLALVTIFLSACKEDDSKSQSAMVTTPSSTSAQPALPQFQVRDFTLTRKGDPLGIGPGISGRGTLFTSDAILSKGRLLAYVRTEQYPFRATFDTTVRVQDGIGTISTFYYFPKPHARRADDYSLSGWTVDGYVPLAVATIRSENAPKAQNASANQLPEIEIRDLVMNQENQDLHWIRVNTRATVVAHGEALKTGIHQVVLSAEAGDRDESRIETDVIIKDGVGTLSVDDFCLKVDMNGCMAKPVEWGVFGYATCRSGTVAVDGAAKRETTDGAQLAIRSPIVSVDYEGDKSVVRFVAQLVALDNATKQGSYLVSLRAKPPGKEGEYPVSVLLKDGVGILRESSSISAKDELSKEGVSWSDWRIECVLPLKQATIKNN